MRSTPLEQAATWFNRWGTKLGVADSAGRHVKAAAQSEVCRTAYFVSTVGRDETVIRECIKNKDKEDERLDPFGLWR